MLLLVVAALVFGVSRETTYSAESVVSVVPVEQGLGQFEREVFLEDVTGVSATEELLRETIATTGWRGPYEQFRSRLEPEYFVRENGDSGVIVRFDGRTPGEAVEVVNVYGALLTERIANLNERRIAEGDIAAEARVRNEASLGQVSRSPGSLLFCMLGAVLGLVIGGGVALLLEGRTKEWRDARDAEMTLQAPVIGVIPDYFAITDSEETGGR